MASTLEDAVRVMEVQMRDAEAAFSQVLQLYLKSIRTRLPHRVRDTLLSECVGRCDPEGRPRIPPMFSLRRRLHANPTDEITWAPVQLRLWAFDGQHEVLAAIQSGVNPGRDQDPYQKSVGDYVASERIHN